jgi:type VI secretion system protein ImpH
VTELVHERVRAKRDHTLADFIDLFHHRALTHFYRAWSQSQSAAGLDRADDETFTPYVSRLAGDEPLQVQGSALAPHARWASIAHRVRAARNPDGLVSTLAHFFGVSVQLHEYQLQWMPIEPQDQCLLGQPRASGMLGVGAMIGDVVPDRQSRFRLVIGPLDMQAYLRLTPQGSASGKDLPALVDLVRSFIGFEYVWEVQLLIHRKAAPSAQLGDDTQLGWSTWMANQTDQTEGAPVITGMIFEPENYAVGAHA